MSSKTWLITGAARGFGRVWTEAALERGDSVAATARDVAALAPLVEAWGDAFAPIELDVTGRVQAVHFSPRLDFVPLQPPADLEAYYRARRAFDHLLRSPEFEFRFLLNAGELVMMDNRRLLHGRTGFDPAEGLRHLQGCYIDIDGPRSLYRVLRRRLGGVEEGGR